MAVIMLVHGEGCWGDESLHTALSDAGYDVVRTEAERAQQMIQHHHPALLVLSVLGCQAADLDLRRVLIDECCAPFVEVSYSQDEERRITALDAGVDDYMTRPVNPQELVARVRSILQRKAAYQKFSIQAS